MRIHYIFSSSTSKPSSHLPFDPSSETLQRCAIVIYICLPFAPKNKTAPSCKSTQTGNQILILCVLLVLHWIAQQYKYTTAPSLKNRKFHADQVMAHYSTNSNFLALFLFTCRIRFILSQTRSTLTNFIEKNNNIYHTKFIWLNPPWNICCLCICWLV